MDWLTVCGWLAGPMATALIAWLGASLRAARSRERERDARRDAEHEALCMGMREEMRSKLYAMHERYVVRGESMPYHEKERAESVFTVYHSLGGNGTGEHVYQELLEAYVEGRHGRC